MRRKYCMGFKPSLLASESKILLRQPAIGKINTWNHEGGFKLILSNNRFKLATDNCFSSVASSFQNKISINIPNSYLYLSNLTWLQFSSVQFSAVAQSCPTLCEPMNRSTPGLPVHHQLQESTQTHVHWVSDAIQPSHPLSSPSPPALNLSQHRVFSNESALHIRWPKYWSFSSNISPSSEHPGLISFRMELA